MVASASYAEQVLLPYATARENVPLATAFRSTWITSSLDSLRHIGRFDEYLSALRSLSSDPRIEQQLLSCVAGEWLPIRSVRVHYEACNSLALREEDLVALAVDAGDIRRAWHAQFINNAQRSEATPWTVFPQLQKLWLRTADGGAAAVFRTGPNQTRVEYSGCELFEIRHFRHAVRAVLVVLGGHVCERLQVVTRVPQDRGQVIYHLSWG